MKNARYLVLFILVLVMALVSAPTTFAKELKIGYFVLSPHGIREQNGTAVGSAVDWFNRYIAPEMNDTFVWVARPLPVPRLLDSLKKGTVDAAILFAKNAERAEYLYYPQKPYLESVNALLVKKDFRYDKIDSLSQVKNIKIGYGAGAFIPPPVKAANLNFDLVAAVNFYEVNIKKLLAGRIDALFDPQDTVLEYAALTYKVVDQTKVISLPGGLIGSYTVFSKKSTSPNVVQQYDRALEKAMAKMPYVEFVKTWKEPGR